MRSLICESPWHHVSWQVITHTRRATEDSILAIQIFDQKKFKKKDQGFLGVINIRVGDVIDFDAGGDGDYWPSHP